MLINNEMFKLRILNSLHKAKNNKEVFLDELDKLYNEMNPEDLDHMTVEERRCYGSPLNKFIGENTKRLKNIMAINIDLLLYDRWREKMRFIEYKHGNENMSSGQKETLKTLAKTLSHSERIKADVCVVQSDYPFNHGEIINLTKDTIRGFTTQKELVELLNITNL